MTVAASNLSELWLLGMGVAAALIGLLGWGDVLAARLARLLRGGR